METNNKPNGKAITSFIVSCVSILCGCCVWYVAILCGVVGIVLGILALREDTKKYQDLAIAGIVVGGTGLAIGIAAAVMYIMLFSAAGSSPFDATDGSDAVLMAIHSLPLLFK